MTPIYRHTTIASVDRPVAFTMDGSPLTRVEPVTVAQVKAALKISHSLEDALFEGWIAAARTFWEYATERQLITAEWELVIVGTPARRRIELPRPPLTEVVAVTYLDDAGEMQTVDPATYRVTLSGTVVGSPPTITIDPYCRPGTIELIAGTWPTTRELRIRRRCGYGPTPADMPQLVQAALYFLVGHFNKYREETTSQAANTIPLGAQMLIHGFKFTAAADRVGGFDAGQCW